jgi:hypothetical protein
LVGRVSVQAVQMHVAFSRTIKGAGIIAGVPYWCTCARTQRERERDDGDDDDDDIELNM